MQALWQYKRIGAQLRQHQNDDPELFNSAHHRAGDRDAIHRTLTEASRRASHDGEDTVEPEIVQLLEDKTDLGSSDAETLADELGPRLDGVEARDRNTIEGKGSMVFIVGWSTNDPANPRSWSIARRTLITVNIAAIAFSCLVSSSIDSAVAPQAAAEFHVSPVVESLATAMFLIGSGVGSIFAGPFSETFGRTPVYLGSLSLFAIWVMASALSPNITGQIIFRFFVGIFGCAPLTCCGGSISDLWNPFQKIWAFTLFASISFGGPIIGPVIGAWIYVPNCPSWRWVDWTTLILAGLVTTISFFLLPETHPAIIQSWKAKHLRNMTQDDRYVARVEIVQLTFWHRMKKALYRPFVLAKEPIVAAITVYLTIIWAILFTFLDGYTSIFQETYDISQGITNTIFIAMYVGVPCASVITAYIYWATKKEMDKQREAGIENPTLRPETRLWWAMYGGSWSIPVSLFWLAWTTYPSISIWVPIISTPFFGLGFITIFISTYLYIIDAYEVNAASALTFCTVVRYLFSGGLVVAGVPFYEQVGRHWAVCILAVFSLLCAPIPFLLYRYGAKLRRASKNAINKE